MEADLVQVALYKPTDYAAVYRTANSELGKIRYRDTWAETELYLHLSPVTPATAAVWSLLTNLRDGHLERKRICKKPYVKGHRMPDMMVPPHSVRHLQTVRLHGVLSMIEHFF